MHALFKKKKITFNFHNFNESDLLYILLFYIIRDLNIDLGDGRMVERCYLVLQSAGSNPALGMDVCSRSESALSSRSRSNQPSCSKKQTVALQTNHRFHFYYDFMFNIWKGCYRSHRNTRSFSWGRELCPLVIKYKLMDKILKITNISFAQGY